MNDPTSVPDLNGLPARALVNLLRTGRLRRPAIGWLRRHADGPPDVLERLASYWLRLDRQPDGERPQTLYGLMGLAAGSPARSLPPLALIRRMAGDLQASEGSSAWEAAEGLLSGVRGQATGRRWAEVLAPARAAKRARDAAAVRFGQVRPMLQSAYRFLARRWQRLPLRGKELAGFTAHTDGGSITLPETLTLSADRCVNEWGYLYLLAHEVEHLEAGSFLFSFATPRGQRLWERLAPRRATFCENRSRWRADDLVRRLRDEGALPAHGRTPSLPHLTAFQMHFANPAAAHGVFNLIEDVRIERSLALRFPVLGEVSALLEEHAAALRRHPRLLTAAETFHLAVADRALGRPVRSFIPSAYRAAWEQIVPKLDGFRTGPLGTAEDAAWVALDVIEAFERLPENGREELEERLAAAAPVPSDEVAVRLLGLSPEENRPDGFRHELRYPESKEGPPPTSGFVYDEWNGFTDTLEPRAAEVRERPFVPYQAPYPAPRMTLPALPAMRLRGGARLRAAGPTVEGDELDPSRAFDALTDLRSGRGVSDPKVYRGRRPASAAAWRVTFLIDLTISMEVPRPRHPTTNPLARGLRLVGWLGPWLGRAGVRVAVAGVQDNGRRPVDYFTIQDAGRPFDAATLSRVHAVGAAGCRLGAAIRHAGRRCPGRPGERHLFVMLTDAGSHYVTAGQDEVLRERLTGTRCRGCSLRSRCPVEPTRSKTSLESRELAFFYPAFYEGADIRHALRTNPHLEPLLLLLDDGYSDAFLDSSVGAGRWARVADDLDVEALPGLVGRLLGW